MLDIDKQKIRLRTGYHLGHKRARDAVCDAHEAFAGVGLGVFERLPEVGWLGEHSRAVGGVRMQRGLSAVGDEGWGSHDGRVCAWVFGRYVDR